MKDIGPPVLDDGYRSYQLGHASIREYGIRKGHVEPRPNSEEELRWKAEGYRHWSELDTVRKPR